MVATVEITAEISVLPSRDASEVTSSDRTMDSTSSR